MLPNSSPVPLPVMVDDEYLLEDGEGTQPATSQCRIGAFVYTVQLLDILNEVLHSFYADDDQSQDRTTGKHEERTMPDLHEMLRLNSKLDRFLEALPRNLTLKSVLLSSEAPTCNALLQARVLHCRWVFSESPPQINAPTIVTNSIQVLIYATPPTAASYSLSSSVSFK